MRDAGSFSNGDRIKTPAANDDCIDEKVRHTPNADAAGSFLMLPQPSYRIHLGREKKSDFF
jgi:hypothetical protein